MHITENYSLLKLNTFKINALAKYYYEYNNPENISELIQKGYLPSKKHLILGGGSNLLFLRNFDGLVIHPVNSYITVIDESNDYVLVKAGAGLNWDTFVKYCTDKGWGGIENLSNIPGSVGASPVQNIGAYGVEAKDVIFEVNIVSLENGSFKTLSNEECKFGYRNSIFKNEYKDKYIVDSVVYKLNKHQQLITHYGSLQSELGSISNPGINDIREVIIKTRSEKLPDPDIIGNGGSFFKNPVIDKKQADMLTAKYTNMVTYPVSENETKLAAGWLIDNCGLKGYVNKNGTAGIHSKQALVLVNKGGAAGIDIQEVAEMVQNTVYKKFKVQLEPEVIYVE